MASGEPIEVPIITEDPMARADRLNTYMVLQEQVLDAFRALVVKGLLKEGESVMVSILPEGATEGSEPRLYHRVWNKSLTTKETN